MRNFNSLPSDVEVRMNLVHLKSPEESNMARRCWKFETLT